jgi:hypothetical protein
MLVLGRWEEVPLLVLAKAEEDEVGGLLEEAKEIVLPFPPLTLTVFSTPLPALLSALLLERAPKRPARLGFLLIFFFASVLSSFSFFSFVLFFPLKLPRPENVLARSLRRLLPFCAVAPPEEVKENPTRRMRESPLEAENFDCGWSSGRVRVEAVGRVA